MEEADPPKFDPQAGPAPLDAQYGGYSALAAYALLSAGEKPTDPRMVRALNFLKRTDTTGTYALGVRCQVWHLAPSEESRKWATSDSARLLQGMGKDGDALGMWDYVSGSYGAKNRGTRVDHSASQYGVLGLWAVSQEGVPLPPSLWPTLDRQWRSQQNEDGGWAYTGDKGGSSTASMTAAGVASLFITQDMIGPAPGPWCRGNMVDENVARGMAWMGAHFDQVTNAYTLYGVERIGTASGYKYLGKVDWFAVGADRLVKEQTPDGGWSFGGGANDAPIADTAFAMLFLAHGRSPVLVNKLNYAVADEPPAGQSGRGSAVDKLFGPGPGAAPPASQPATAPAAAPVDRPWNQRPRDVANLVYHMRANLETFFNWQIVNLAAPVEELHDAPVLYISGSKALALTPGQEARLKQFVEQGGMILANADCPTGRADDPFTRSVVDLGHRLFARRFRPLPANHVILNEQQYKSTRWKEQPTVLGLTNGVRELMILLPSNDPGRAWQQNATKI